MAFININKDNYYHNLNECLSRVESIDKLILVLKDNAYAHGIELISDLARDFGITFVAVKNHSDAKIIKDKFKNILLLSERAFSYAPEPNYILGINDLATLKRLASSTKIALKLDSGMHRNGIMPGELEAALKIIRQKNLRLVSAYTHYSSPAHISAQKPVYQQMKDFLESNYPEQIFFHSASSNALFLGENDIDGAARVGLAQYGYCEFCDTLKPVLSLHAQLLSEREIAAGECVGYDEVFCAAHDMKIACYDLGYADGLLYYKGSGEFCLANGQKVLGKISMDSFVSAPASEQICVFDNVEKYAKYFNTSAYEALVRLSPTIPRHLI